MPPKARWRYSRDEVPTTQAFDTETYRGQVKVVCTPTAFFEPDKDAEHLIGWIWENGKELNWLWNISFDRDVVLRPYLESEAFGEEEKARLLLSHRVKIGKFLVTIIGNKSFSINTGRHKRKTFYDAGTFYRDAETALPLDVVAKEVLGAGKNAGELGISRQRIGEEEGYYEANREKIIEYCKQDANLTKLLGDRLFVVSKAALGYYPKRWSSPASLAKAWLERNAADLMKKPEKNPHEPFHHSYRGGIFMSTLGREKNVSEVDICCLADDTRVDGRMIRDVRVGDTVNGQRVIDVRRFQNAPCIELGVASGHVITSTKDHRHAVPANGSAKTALRAASRVRRDGYLLVDDWPCRPLSDEAVMSGVLHAEGSWTLHKRVWKKDARMGPNGGRFGYSNRITISIDERETELRAFITKFLRDRDYTYHETTRGHGLEFKMWRETEVNELRLMYEQHARAAAPDDAAGFLRGFFEGDGTVNAARHTITAVQADAEKTAVVKNKMVQLGFHPYRYEMMVSQIGLECKMRRAHCDAALAYTCFEITQREIPRWMNVVGFVSRAKRQRVAAKVISKREVGKRDVTDITLDGDHLYYANGVLTHNSAYGYALLHAPKLEALTGPIDSTNVSDDAVLGSYYCMVEFDGKIPYRSEDAFAVPLRPEKHLVERIIYPNSHGKLRPYYADLVEIRHWQRTGRRYHVLNGFEYKWRSKRKGELQFPTLRHLLDRIVTLKAEGNRGNISAKLQREFLKKIVVSIYGCMAEAKHGETPWTTWPMASFITASCRRQIWEQWEKIDQGGGRVISVNTDCLADNTVLSDGKRIGDVLAGDIVDGQRVTDVRHFMKPTYRLAFDNGREVVASAEHRFLSDGGCVERMRLIEVGQMHAGTIRSTTVVTNGWDSVAHPPDSVFAGIMWAEGSRFIDKTISRKNYRHPDEPPCSWTRSRLSLTVGAKETELRQFLRDYLRAARVHFSERPYPDGINACEFSVWRTRDVRLLGDAYREAAGSSDADTMRGFLCGAFEGGGCGRGRVISVTQVDAVKRSTVTRMLSAMGYRFSIYETDAHTVQFARGAHAASKRHTMRLNARDVTRWMREVSFLSAHKRSRVSAKLIRKEPAGMLPVTDLSLDGDHLFWANGMRSHNSIRYRKGAYTVPLTFTGEVGGFETKFDGCEVVHYQSGIAVILHPPGHEVSCKECAKLPRVVKRHGKWEGHANRCRDPTTGELCGKPDCHPAGCPCCQKDGHAAFVRRRGMPSLTPAMLLNAHGTELYVSSRRGLHIMEGVIQNRMGEIGDIRTARDENDGARNRPIRLDANLMCFSIDPKDLRFEVFSKKSVACLPPEYDTLVGGKWKEMQWDVREEEFGTSEREALKRLKKAHPRVEHVVPMDFIEWTSTEIGYVPLTLPALPMGVKVVPQKYYFPTMPITHFTTTTRPLAAEPSDGI